MKPPYARSAVPGVGRLGLVEPTAPDELKAIGWSDLDSVELLWSLSRAANADLALRTLVRIQEGLGDAWAELDSALHTDKGLRGRLFGLIGASSAFGDHLVADPSSWKLLAGDMTLPSKEEMTRRLLACVGAVPETGPNASSMLYRAELTGPEAIAALRKCYRDQMMVLAAADLAATVENEPVVPYQTVGHQLSDMADAALTAALAVAVTAVSPDEPCPARIAVIAMGKCGARELNYVSDVDVVFVAEPSDAVSSRIAGEMMRIGSAAFFEVDAALRPEGKRGELVRTLDSHIAYYKRWAKTWEFQALLKARPMTGDLDLGRQYTEALGPMVWTAAEREDFVPEVQAMRRRVENSVPPELRERELKLGRGSLRDVEFAVQLLQLVHGRADTSLRVKSTVDALTALAAGGYVGRDDAANLTASYEFLRLLEHRLQLQKLKRTHTLPPPDDEEALRWLARAAHMRPDGRNDALGVLNAEIKRNSHRVRRLHAKLFYRPLLESVARIDKEALRLSPDAAVRQLAALGYSAPQNALGHLTALTGGASRKGRIQALLLPTLLEWLGDTPDPDAGLLAYRRLSDALVDATWFLRLLRDEASVAQRLMTVLGSSAYIPDLLIKAPDVIRLFADGPSGPRLLEPHEGVDETRAVKWANLIGDRVRTLLGAPSTDPPLEVDIGLRPEGRSGPLVRTLTSYEAYYAQWAQAWEVQALLRAHAVAGDAELGLRFLHMIDKTRYPEGGVSEQAVREIRRIKARVDSERLPRGADPATHTKLGRGGLADIEWTVQLIQLRHAHEIPSLHNTSTLETLDAIGAAELLSESDVELLRDAWLLATKARNALVLVRGKPTDQLPGPGKVLAAVAQVAGWPGGDANEFLDNYLRVTRRAKAVVQRVFGGE